MGTTTTVEMERLVKAVVLNKRSFVPLYRQISEGIRAAIMRGELKPEELLPSEREIAEALGVAQMTVRQALLELKREGLVYRRRGVGTFISFPKFEHTLTTLVSFTEDMKARGMTPGSKTLFFGFVPANNAVACCLDLREGELVLRVCRLRLANGQPVGIHDAYLPSYVTISRDELERKGSLYALLQEKGFLLKEAEETIEAVSATEQEAELLGLSAGDPLLKVVRTVLTHDDRPIEHVIAIYRSDLYRYRIRLKRNVYGGGGDENSK